MFKNWLSKSISREEIYLNIYLRYIGGSLMNDIFEYWNLRSLLSKESIFTPNVCKVLEETDFSTIWKCSVCLKQQSLHSLLYKAKIFVKEVNLALRYGFRKPPNLIETSVVVKWKCPFFYSQLLNLCSYWVPSIHEWNSKINTLFIYYFFITIFSSIVNMQSFDFSRNFIALNLFKGNMSLLTSFIFSNINKSVTRWNQDLFNRKYIWHLL